MTERWDLVPQWYPEATEAIRITGLLPVSEFNFKLMWYSQRTQSSVCPRKLEDSGDHGLGLVAVQSPHRTWLWVPHWGEQGGACAQGSCVEEHVYKDCGCRSMHITVVDEGTWAQRLWMEALEHKVGGLAAQVLTRPPFIA